MRRLLSYLLPLAAAAIAQVVVSVLGLDGIAMFGVYFAAVAVAVTALIVAEIRATWTRPQGAHGHVVRGA